MLNVTSSQDVRQLRDDATEVHGVNLGDNELSLLTEKTAIRTLDLSGCDLITDLSVTRIRNLQALERLDLSFCNLITDESVKALSQLPALRWLNLNACYSIGDASLIALAATKSLEYLSLWSCEEITDTGVEKLSELPKLTQLELPEFAEITDAALRSLAAGGVALRVLRLDHLEGVSDEGIGALRSLKRLTTLTVQSCRMVTEAGIGALQNALPDCRIVFSQ